MIPGFFQGTEMPTAGWWEALWPDPARVLALVGITPGMSVVDLCSGDLRYGPVKLLFDHQGLAFGFQRRRFCPKLVPIAL